MKINLEYVMLTSFIQVYYTLAKCLTIQSLEASDNTRYQMPSKIVDEKTDEPLFGTHLQLKQLDPPKLHK
jgi:hypothetical protein